MLGCSLREPKAVLPDAGGVSALLPAALALGLPGERGDVGQLAPAQVVGQVRHGRAGHAPHHVVRLNAGWGVG